MESIAHFRQIAATSLRDWGKVFPEYRPIGVFNAYVPLVLLQAAGFTPVYLFHRRTDLGNTRTHLPSFTCWPGKSLVDQALSGELDGLHGLAFAKTCDTVQALTDICREVMPNVPIYHFGMPSNLSSRMARPYLEKELLQLRGALGDPSDESLFNACQVYNQTGALIDELFRIALCLAPTDLYAILKAGHLMPKVLLNRRLAQLLHEIDDLPFQGPRLVLVGPHLSDESVFQAIERAGARIVDEILDAGRRYYDGSAAQEGDLISGLADRLLGKLPTPTKYHSARRRDDILIERVERSQADGVVFSRQAFCDPHGFDYASSAAALDARGIPHLYLELEQASQIGQIHTRVEAFLEMIAK
jgi:benzoyl-CoA reductase/2-hydroxyglutaryl-CoA dehydratase subunit BcrC/BadD/HgdB